MKFRIYDQVWSLNSNIYEVVEFVNLLAFNLFDKFFIVKLIKLAIWDH